jgi:hypothetical protein
LLGKGTPTYLAPCRAQVVFFPRAMPDAVMRCPVGAPQLALCGTAFTQSPPECVRGPVPITVFRFKLLKGGREPDFGERQCRFALALQTRIDRRTLLRSV